MLGCARHLAHVALSIVYLRSLNHTAMCIPMGVESGSTRRVAPVQIFTARMARLTDKRDVVRGGFVGLAATGLLRALTAPAPTAAARERFTKSSRFSGRGLL